LYEADSSFYGLLLAEPTPELILKIAEWAETKRVLFGANTQSFDNPLKNKKIPYTDKGVDLVRCEIMAQLKEAITVGVLASQPEPTVHAPKVADIPDLDKSKRLLPNVSFSGTFAGAIHALKINGVVSL
jgi:hypothetical protein